MKIITFLITILLIISCEHLSFNSDSNKKTTILKEHNSQFEFDSIVVNYWRNFDANEYTIKYSNGEIRIFCNYSSIEKIITDKDIIDKFERYVDVFFITKSEKIEYNRLKSTDPIVTDYSILKINVFYENRQVCKESIPIGEEKYDIDYNPKFLEFYKLLDTLVCQK